MALPSIPLPPLMLTPNLGLNADAQNPSPTAGSAGLPLVPLQVSTSTCAATALDGMSSQPTMAASLRAATDTVISAVTPPMAGVSGDTQGALQTPQPQQIT